MNKIITILPLMIMSGGFLVAQSDEMRFGIQCMASRPIGDFGNALNNKFGIGIGVDLSIPYKEKHSFVPNITYVQYDSKYKTGAMYHDYEAKVISVGLDYRYAPSAKEAAGPFFSLGIGYSNRKFSGDFGMSYSWNESVSSNDNAIYFQSGIGYFLFKNFEVELKYQYQKFSSAPEWIADAPALRCSFTYRF